MLTLMNIALKSRILPPRQRRTLSELTDDLDLTSGDRWAKTSAFWTMLVLSAIIASAGVMTDSTATVIGAMIIAPLATPIMGIALGIAKAVPRAIGPSVRYVVTGGLLVVAVGYVFPLFTPGTMQLLDNPQITGRTSPGLLDLVAAVATGLAGSVALARRDVAAVLPGVAIAISLVPPLAVVGICLGEGAPGLAFGAFVLFASNLVAMVLAGTLVFAVLGYGGEGARAEGGSRRKAYVTIGVALTIVAIPLLGNTIATYYIALLSERVEVAAEDWLDGVDGASVEDVAFTGPTVSITIQSPAGLPPTEPLMEALADVLPGGTEVLLDSTRGERSDLGPVQAR
jgi:uncharacterized hydrophobic protein (TIGR00271 family)